jgi:phosphatidylserine/phosphatidylglycerophosphate/cardiolipin synthase-like enzyme
MSHKLIVLPDDGADAVIGPIMSARRELNIRMFLFTDPSLLNAVIAAQSRGVHVRIMLNPARRDGTSDNDAARAALLAASVSAARNSRSLTRNRW